MNYLSRPANVDQPISRGDINFDVGVLNQLQTRYDANKAIVDQTIAQYESLRGLTDTDNEYIASQVSNIKNQLNSLGGLNLAHNTGRDSILNNMKNVLKDPIVQDILTSKHNKDAYDAEYQKIVEKDPSKASMANYAYGLKQGGFNDYVNGKAKKVTNMTYKPFEDVQGNYTKRLKEYVDQYDDEQHLSTENGTYQTVEVYGKKILKNDLEKFLVATTTPQEREQLQINSWYKYKDLDDSKVSGILQTAFKKDLESMNLYRAEIKAQADAGNEEAKKMLRSKSSWPRKMPRNSDNGQ